MDKSTFNASKLSKEEQQIRELGITALFRSTSKNNPGFTIKDAEAVYDKMQQHCLDEGIYEWRFCKTEKGA